jgi:hypothetical protein
MLSQTLCLEATTLGQVSSFQKFTIEVCGSEIIGLSPSSGVVGIQLNKTDEMNVYSLSDLGFSFSSDRSNCPISSYELLQSDLSLFSGPKLVVDEQTGSLLVDTSFAIDFSGFIAAYSYNKLHQSLLPVEIHVCGYEDIDLTQAQSINRDFTHN